MGIWDAIASLGSDVNKKKDTDQKERLEGVLDKVPELALEMSDEELVSLSKKWEKKWDAFYQKIKGRQEEAQKYWLGVHYAQVQYQDNKRPIQDNVIFEAVETFLPSVTQKNPDPSVTSDNTEEGNALAKTVQKMLTYQADRLRLKLRVKRAVRYWAIFLLGVVKIGWSERDNDIDLNVLRPQKLILDPDGTIDDDMQYTGKFIGEYKKDEASDLIKRFPNKKQEITELVDENLGSSVQYTEWWTNEYTFWRIKEVILGKVKNPHWNYEKQSVDEFGKTQTVKGNNHFLHPEMPYTFLSVFNLGKHPVDDTSLILQNLSNQDQINKRNRQIDKNVDGMNGGWVISGENSGLTKEQSAQAIKAFRQGKGIYIPSGTPQSAVERVMGTGLPNDVYQDRNDTRDRLHDLFGTAGSTAKATKQDRTVRGKMQMQQLDSARFSGSVVEYIEQFSDKIFNWMVQMFYVYYDEEHTASVVGEEKTQEYIKLKNDQLKRKLTVTVKEGSLIPKDSVSKMQLALEMFKLGGIDPITLLDMVDFPNPREAAKRAVISKLNPLNLFPGDPQIQQMQQQSQEGQQVAEAKQKAAEGANLVLQAKMADVQHHHELEKIALQKGMESLQQSQNNEAKQAQIDNQSKEQDNES